MTLPQEASPLGFAERYEAALIAYASSPTEQGLTAAYELGREAVAAEIGLLALADMHREVTAGALGALHCEPAVLAESAGRFLGEALAPFEMVHRGALAREQATLAGVLRSMREGVVVFEGKGTVRYCNQRAGELLSLDAQTLIPNGADLISGRLWDHPIDLGELVRELGATEQHVHTGGSRYRDLGVQLFPVEVPGEASGVGMVIRDVTAELALARAKDELVAIVSHELRTPLAVIVRSAELLGHRLEGKSREYSDHIHSEGLRLTQLINDFLDIQRIEAGGEVIDALATDPGELLDAATAIAGDDPDHPMQVRVESTGLVEADRDRIVRVLVNLIANARKYSPAGAPVQVIARDRPDTIEFRVEDRGFGIPAEAMPHLFEKFYRVDSPAHRTTGGTGLGLAICKGIIESHRGTIWAESTGAGQGATFAFTLPRTP